MLHCKKWAAVFMAVAMMAVTLVPSASALESTGSDAPLVPEGRHTQACERDGAVINNDTDLMNYDGETVTEGLPRTTGIIDESGISTAAVDDVVVVKGSALFSESGAGAHYYAYSAYSNTYTEAFANIKLPTGFNNNSGARNGYISLGITGSQHGIDLGLRNSGSGWHPFYYDVTAHQFTTFEAYVAPSTATNALITVKPVNATTVHLYVQFLNSAGTYVGTPFDRDITVAADNLVSSGGKMMCRYYRFASLVPVGTDNQSDGTYMTGGQITNCQLYNGSSYVSWGISTARVTNAWKVSSSKITLSYTTYNDTFNIRHS